MAPDIINLIDAEGVVIMIPVALETDGAVAGQNADNLMG